MEDYLREYLKQRLIWTKEAFFDDVPRFGSHAYVYYIGGKATYVGCTMDPRNRAKDHFMSYPMWAYLIDEVRYSAATSEKGRYRLEQRWSRIEANRSVYYTHNMLRSHVIQKSINETTPSKYQERAQEFWGKQPWRLMIKPYDEFCELAEKFSRSLDKP